MILIIYAILMLVFLIGAALTAGLESATVGADKIRLRSRGDKAKHALKIKDNPNDFVTALLVGTNICHIAGTSLLTYIVEQLIETNQTLSVYSEQLYIAVPIVMTVVLLIFTEIIPKTYFQQKSESLLIVFAPFLKVLKVVLSPFSIPIMWIILKGAKLFGVKLHDDTADISRDELKVLFTEGHKEGVITRKEQEIIDSIFNFGVTYAREIMVPLVDLKMIESETTIKQLVMEYKHIPHMIIPVFKERVDNIIGYLNVMELFKAKLNEPVTKYMHKPTFVPETKMIDDLFYEMEHDKNTGIFVVDEYGGCAGLITIDDIAEELVGDYSTIPAEETTLYSKNQTGEYVVDASVDIDDLNDEFEIGLPKRGYETLSGFLSWMLERLPKKNDKVKYRNVSFRVIKATDRTCEQVAIKLSKGKSGGKKK